MIIIRNAISAVGKGGGADGSNLSIPQGFERISLSPYSDRNFPNCLTHLQYTGLGHSYIVYCHCTAVKSVHVTAVGTCH